MRKFQGLMFAGLICGLSPALLCAAGPATRPITAPASEGMAIDPVRPPTDIDLQSASPDSNAVAGADGTTSSSSRRFDRNDSVTSSPSGALLGRGRMGQRIFGPVSAKQISDAMTYLSEHSRNRAEAIQSLPDGERKQRVMEVVARNYANWMRILHQDPELYKIVVQRVEVEDSIFGLVTKLRKQPPDQQAATKTQLHDQVAELVNLGIQERQIRLQRLQSTVKELAAKLDDDSAHQSALVDQRLKTILNDGKGLIPSGAGGSNAGHVPHAGEDNR